jgi:hypothetical protein
MADPYTLSVDDLYEDDYYETVSGFINGKEREIIRRKKDSPELKPNFKHPTLLAVIEQHTDIPCWSADETVLKEYNISRYDPNEGGQSGSDHTRCICSQYHPDLKNWFVSFKDKCFLVGGDCFQRIAGDDDDWRKELSKERCKECDILISRKDKRRPHLCVECGRKKKKQELQYQLDKINQDATKVRLKDSKFYGKTWGELTKNEWFCTKVLEDIYIDKTNKYKQSWIKNFAKYLLKYDYYAID